ncbi:PREDICTED: uncharacterized protein LOC108768600 [Trachymyrmex cornetzi]|uniref:uncharacterized protein LOC108768600 n=1 Tax=Trachymyrmex cornetzi TaxID=471704 RepID=UPI00084EE4DA|nr:PREDICTED: uncharacterized protein LOC108768600 [Trachymyrmex cornetzi]
METINMDFFESPTLLFDMLDDRRNGVQDTFSKFKFPVYSRGDSRIGGCYYDSFSYADFLRKFPLYVCNRTYYYLDHQHDIKATDREVAIIGPSIANDISTLCDTAAAVRPGWTSAADYFISLGPPRLGTEGRRF